MIGKRVFYLDNNSIATSTVASIYKRDNGVFVTLESGVGFWERDLCFTIDELFKKLYREFKSQDC